MRARAEKLARGEAGECVFACEHEPVYVTGRRGVDNRLRPELPAPFVHADRGGETTFHGPGQLMLYPVIHVRRRSLGARAYVRMLEESCIALLGGLGIAARRRPGFPGVWTERGKVAALGVRIARGVAFHGMALNVAVEPRWFAAIRPCGMEAPVCRLADFPGLGEPPALATLARRWYDCFCEAASVYSEKGSR